MIPSEQIATARLLVDTLAGKPFLNCEEHDTYLQALKTLNQHLTNSVVVKKLCLDEETISGVGPVRSDGGPGCIPPDHLMLVRWPSGRIDIRETGPGRAMPDGNVQWRDLGHKDRVFPIGNYAETGA